MRHYILDHRGHVKHEPDANKWAIWFNNANEKRRVKFTDCGQDIHVSTVFLGLDHSFQETSKPVLWETIVFGGDMDGRERRYTSRALALKGHYEIVREIRAKQAPFRRRGGEPELLETGAKS